MNGESREQKQIFLIPILLLFVLACNFLTGGGVNDVSESESSDENKKSVAAPIRQWASTASASSEYGSDDWSAKQATGEPDTAECRDSMDAWASENYASGIEWLEVGFDTPVVPTQVNIHETYYPGQVVKVEVRDESGSLQTVWQGEAYVENQCPRVFTVDISNVNTKVTAVKVSLDQSASAYWSELDAIELVGTP